MSDAPQIAITWPLIVVIVTSVLWAMVIASHLLKSEKSGKSPGAVDFKKPIMMLAIPIGYLLALPWLGFTIGTFVFQALFYRLLGGRSWIRNITVAAIISVVLHIMFIELMSMSLPRFAIGSLEI